MFNVTKRQKNKTMYLPLLLCLLIITTTASAYYSDIEPGECPAEPANPIIPTNNTRLYFIGPHHTGTNSYIKAFIHLQDVLGMPLSHPAHDMHWAYTMANKMFNYDVVADTPYRDWNDNIGLEFGNKLHPDVRTLFYCFPKSLYVINTRPIIGYVKTKVIWELGFQGHPTPPCQTETAFSNHPFLYSMLKTDKGKFYGSQSGSNIADYFQSISHPNVKQFPLGYMSIVCQVAYVRERLYLAFLNFIHEDLIHRQPRFLITDIEKEDMQDIVKRLCKFVHINVLPTSSTSVDRLFEMKKQEKINFCNEIAFPPFPMKHHPSVYANIECELESFEYIFMNATGINAPVTFPNKGNTRHLTNECRRISNTFSREELLNDSSIFLVPGEYKTKYKELIEELSTRYSA
jgi:hypothetical protein